MKDELKYREFEHLIHEELERPSKRLTTRSLPKEEKVLETSASASSNGKKKKKKKKKECFRHKSIVDLTYLDGPQRAAFVATAVIHEKSLIARVKLNHYASPIICNMVYILW